MSRRRERGLQVAVARAAGEAGMEVADNAADPRLRLMIDKAIADANDSRQVWSVNDIRDQFPVVSQGLVGRRVRAAAVRGEMVKVGTEPSTLENTHAKDVNRYRGRARPKPARDTAGKFASMGARR